MSGVVELWLPGHDHTRQDRPYPASARSGSGGPFPPQMSQLERASATASCPPPPPPEHFPNHTKKYTHLIEVCHSHGIWHCGGGKSCTDFPFRACFGCCCSERMVTAVIHKGDVFGQHALLQEKPRSTTATVVADCTLLSLDKQVIAEDPIDGPSTPRESRWMNWSRKALNDLRPLLSCPF